MNRDYLEDSTSYADLERRVLILSKEVWERTIESEDIERWLDNFSGRAFTQEEERLHALHLLSHFTYFGSREIRVLIQALYRDKFRYHLVQRIRDRNDCRLSYEEITSEYNDELMSTRFLSMGNPSESGSHLLYYFRQENKLPASLFINQEEIIADDGELIAIEGLRRLVFVDDLLSSGTQAMRYSSRLLTRVVTAAELTGTEIEILYLVLFAKPAGLLKLERDGALFSQVRPLHLLDDSEVAFSDDSRCFSSEVDGITMKKSRKIAELYGERLVPSDPLGFGGGQLMLGFSHNVPNNTLPIFWSDGFDESWNALFPRHEKLYRK